MEYQISYSSWTSKLWWIVIMPLKSTKLFSYGTFIAFDAAQILWLNNFVPIYHLVIRNWSVRKLAFLPYHGLQNCNTDCFAFTRLKYPLKYVSSAENFHIALKLALGPIVQEVKEKGKRTIKKSNIVALVFTLLSKDSWLDSQVTSGKAQHLTMICFKVYKCNY